MNLHLKNGAVAIVDDDDTSALEGYQWDVLPTGFVGAHAHDKNGKPVVLLLNRRILMAPPGWIVEHINGRKLDCRRENLRLAEYRYKNYRGPGGRGKSGIMGVQRLDDAGPNPWRAQIHIQGHNYHLGSFPTAEEAIAMRHAAELSFYGVIKS